MKARYSENFIAVGENPIKKNCGYPVGSYVVIQKIESMGAKGGRGGVKRICGHTNGRIKLLGRFRYIRRFCHGKLIIRKGSS